VSTNPSSPFYCFVAGLRINNRGQLYRQGCRLAFTERDQTIKALFASAKIYPGTTMEGIVGKKPNFKSVADAVGRSRNFVRKVWESIVLNKWFKLCFVLLLFAVVVS
jgi:hypothetical protein